MNLKSDVELRNTKIKLKMLEEQLEDNRRRTEGDDRLRRLSAQSLIRLINQLKEEIVRYESRQSAKR